MRKRLFIQLFRGDEEILTNKLIDVPVIKNRSFWDVYKSASQAKIEAWNKWYTWLFCWTHGNNICVRGNTFTFSIETLIELPVGVNNWWRVYHIKVTKDNSILTPTNRIIDKDTGAVLDFAQPFTDSEYSFLQERFN